MKYQALIAILFFFFSCSSEPKNKISKSGDLYIPSDLEVTLWAESPMLNNPTNMDVDIKGRIWVTEAVNYRKSSLLHSSKGDRIVILEDTDKDGKADSSKVFVQDPDLVAPLGIAVFGNRIVVSCSPNLIVYTDENGDDVPDKKEILLTGFGGKDHDHSLHAAYAGPDGNWYFNTGNAGPHIVTDKAGWTLRSGSMYSGGSPNNIPSHGNMVSDDGKVYTGGLALRINPEGKQMKVLAHNFRNSYEVIPDSYGNLWQNDNDDEVVACRTAWLMEGGNAGYFNDDGTRSWQADQRVGQDLFNAHWHQDDPGVMPAGDRTGAGAPTGITVIESDELGEEYRGMVLSADAGRNMIFGYHPEIKSSGYDLGQRQIFISSIDSSNEKYVWYDSTHYKHKEKWFRPSDVTIGTDGAIYVADWYDPVVGGHQMQDSALYGRIYRITKKGKKMTAPVIDLNSVKGQLDALKNPAINVRNAGFIKLKEHSKSVIADVKKLLNNDNPYIRARAIWLLANLGTEGKAETEKLLSDPNELTRAVAYRALRQITPDISNYANKTVADPSPFVRREVAISVSNLPYENKKGVLLELIKSFDGNDRWYLETIGKALEKNEQEIYPEIKRTLQQQKPSIEWNNSMTLLAWRLHPPASINDLALRAKDSTLSMAERQKAITALSFIRTAEAVQQMVELGNSALPDVSTSAKYWLAYRQTNDWTDLMSRSNIQFNTAYERKVTEMKVKMQIVLDDRQLDEVKKWWVWEMAEDSIGGQMLIGLAAEKKLPANMVPYVEEKIFNNPDLTVRTQAKNYFNSHFNSKEYSVDQILQFKTNPESGKQLFITNCTTCHRVENNGNTIGPDLTFIAKKFDDRQLLEAIIEPSEAIAFGYEPWLVNTSDNTSVFGFLISDNKESMVIRDVAGNNHVIKKDKIISSKKQDKSLMPGAAEMRLTEQDLRDIAGYLRQK